MNVSDICDYLLVKASESGVFVSLMKLHKLVYYSEAWWLARNGEGLTGASFQAWVHGPMNAELADRFHNRKRGFYLRMDLKDVRPGFDPASMPKEVRDYLDEILQVYVSLSGSQLEEIVCSERPWVLARGGCEPSQRCETVIDVAVMQKYYGEKFQANSRRIPTPQAEPAASW